MDPYSITKEEESFSGLIEALTKHGEAMVRSFEKNQTLVEQGARNDCFYRLLSGKVRFEKRIREENIILSVALLGEMEESANWRYFCELSALGILEKTSAAVVAESDVVTVLVIPVDVFNEVIQKNSSCATRFFQSLTKRLAELLRSLHLRTIRLYSLNIPASGQQIHNEVVRLSWACTTKTGVSKSNGQLLLSRHYVAFLRQKDNDKKGVVADAADCGKIVIHLNELSDIIQTPKKARLTLQAAGQSKIVLSFKKEQDAQLARDILSTAKIAVQKQRGVNPLKQVKEQRLVICTHCQDYFCSYCQLLNQMKNPCVSGQRHVFSVERTVYRVENSCGRCGNTGTHILTPSDLQILLDKKFQTQFYSENTIIQKMDTQVVRVGYILDGSVHVKVINEAGEELQLNDVVSGETIGDIGVFIGRNSSAELSAGVGGCLILSIPKSFLVDEGESDFRTRVCFSLMELMWNRITRQEAVQIEVWMEKLKAERSLEEDLLRERFGKEFGSEFDF